MQNIAKYSRRMKSRQRTAAGQSRIASPLVSPRSTIRDILEFLRELVVKQLGGLVFMHYRVLKLFALLVTVQFASVAFAQSGCVKDDLGRIFCAPAGGYAVKTLTGVACAPGRCVTDNLGYLKCSRELGGGATKDDLGRAVCVGGCVSPSREFCVKPPEEKR